MPDVLAMSDEFYLPDAKLVYRKDHRHGNKEVLPYLGLGQYRVHSGDIAEAEKWFMPARESAARNIRRYCSPGDG